MLEENETSDSKAKLSLVADVNIKQFPEINQNKTSLQKNQEQIVKIQKPTRSTISYNPQVVKLNNKDYILKYKQKDKDIKIKRLNKSLLSKRVFIKALDFALENKQKIQIMKIKKKKKKPKQVLKQSENQQEQSQESFSKEEQIPSGLNKVTEDLIDSEDEEKKLTVLKKPNPPANSKPFQLMQRNNFKKEVQAQPEIQNTLQTFITEQDNKEIRKSQFMKQFKGRERLTNQPVFIKQAPNRLLVGEQTRVSELQAEGNILNGTYQNNSKLALFHQNIVKFIELFDSANETNLILE